MTLSFRRGLQEKHVLFELVELLLQTVWVTVISRVAVFNCMKSYNFHSPAQIVAFYNFILIYMFLFEYLCKLNFSSFLRR